MVQPTGPGGAATGTIIITLARLLAGLLIIVPEHGGTAATAHMSAVMDRMAMRCNGAAAAAAEPACLLRCHVYDMHCISELKHLAVLAGIEHRAADAQCGRCRHQQQHCAHPAVAAAQAS